MTTKNDGRPEKLASQFFTEHVDGLAKPGQSEYSSIRAIILAYTVAERKILNPHDTISWRLATYDAGYNGWIEGINLIYSTVNVDRTIFLRAAVQNNQTEVLWEFRRYKMIYDHAWLNVAAAYGHLRMIRLLCKFKVGYPHLAISVALHGGRFLAAKLLISLNPQLVKTYGLEWLRVAIEYGNAKTIIYLISLGINLNAYIYPSERILRCLSAF